MLDNFQKISNYNFDYIFYIPCREEKNDIFASLINNNVIYIKRNYGEIKGKTREEKIKIMAVNKDDPSITFIKQFTVVQDTKTYSQVIYSEFSDTHKLSNGEYQLGLDVLNSPYSMAQYYSWRVVSKSLTITSVKIDQWGNVTIVLKGSVVIEGYNYIYNDNYGVRINLIVTN